MVPSSAGSDSDSMESNNHANYITEYTLLSVQVCDYYIRLHNILK